MTRQIVAIATLVAGALGAASASVAVADSDVFWHLATARESIANGLVRSEMFSWTVRGAPVSTDQWLGQLALYAGYAAGSWQGVVAIRTLAVALLVGAIAASALVRRPGSPVIALAVAVPAIVLSRFLWTERPELFGAAFFAVLVLLLQLPGRVPLYVAGALLVLWANVHGSFALGAALVLLVCAHGLATGRPERRAYAVAAAAALLSFVATPAGLGTFTSPGIHLFAPPRQIQEWSLPDPTRPAGAVWALLLGAVVATAALARAARARDVLIVVPVALLSLLAVRHMPLFAVAATPFLAAGLPDALAAVAERIGLVARSRATGRPAPKGIDLAVAAAGVVLLVASVAVAPGAPDETTYPTAALERLRPGPGLFAQYDWGGWLIWRAPATPVFIDGRFVPYRGAVLADYFRVLEAHPGWRDVLKRRGITQILVRPGDPVAVRARELGWRTVSGPKYVLIEVSDP